jgi:hypothetical protein
MRTVANATRWRKAETDFTPKWEFRPVEKWQALGNGWLAWFRGIWFFTGLKRTAKQPAGE